MICLPQVLIGQEKPPVMKWWNWEGATVRCGVKEAEVKSPGSRGGRREATIVEWGSRWEAVAGPNYEQF